MKIVDSTNIDYPEAEWNFIYNRFDLSYCEEKNCFIVTDEEGSDNDSSIIPYHREGNVVLLGMWLNNISNEDFYAVCKYCFKTFSNIRKIQYKNRAEIPNAKEARKQNDQCIVGNHWKIELPKTFDELLSRVSSKTRYNIRREKRIAEERLGLLQFKHLKVNEIDNTAKKIVEKYFDFKLSTHGTDYHLTSEEYLRQYYVTDIYALYYQETNIGAVLFSCEQTDVVYLENLSYDPTLSDYSLGAVLYNYFLGEIIAKGKRELILGAGHQKYKSLYGGIEQNVCSGTVYRHKTVYLFCKAKHFFSRAIGYIKRRMLRNKKNAL